MASDTETFVFNSEIAGDEKTISAEPSPAYTLTSKKLQFKEEKKPSSVFTLRHTPEGELEFTSNRKIIRLTIETKYNKDAQPSGWQSSTVIKADVIPTNSDVIKQVEQDVYNAQTKAVLHADRVWDEKKAKGEKKKKTIEEGAPKKRSWWSFTKSKAT